MAWYDRFIGKKDAQLAFTTRWQPVVWPSISFSRLAQEGYRQNSAVFQCVSALVFGYQQPRPIAVRNGEPQPRHPLQALLDRPNALMAWNELAIYIATYKAIGGQCYLHKVRNRAGAVIELWPYHVGQLTPIPGRFSWIDAYEYDDGSGTRTRVERDDIIHLKWPAIDLETPWLALAPLVAVAREVDTDTEMTRYLYALLKNDAVVSTVINVKKSMTETEFEHFQQTWNQRHGGDNRGGIGLLEGEATISRLGLNLREMAFDALRRVPEARIAGAFKVPPEYVGLNVGLEHSTYSNKQEARRGFIEDTITQLCTLDAGELTADLAAEFAGGATVEFDFEGIIALQENEDARWTRVVQGYDANLITKNEARNYIGFDDVPDGDTFKTEAQPAPPPIIDVQPVTPALLTDEQVDEKALRAAALKVLRRTATEQVQQELRRALLPYLDEQRREALGEAG